jgi:protein SCO1/2
MKVLAALVLGVMLSASSRAAPAEAWLAGVDFEQRLGARVPLDPLFADEAGAAVRLGDFVGRGPLLLVLGYYACRNLCGTLIGELAGRLRELDLRAGRDFQVVVVSVDPDETPASARARKAQYRGAVDAWHFLTGDAAAVRALAAAVGYRYRRERAAAGFVHPAGVVIVAPDARVSRYLFALDPDDAALRYGIIAASGNRLGSASDRLWLLCHGFDPATGRYTGLVTDLGRGLGLASAAAFAGLVGLLVRRVRRRR